MTALHLAYTELRRIAATWVGKLTLLALVLIPTLYAGLYLYANSDPYANLDQVPAAVVMEDQGATDATGKPLEYGDDIAQELIAQDSFDWQEATRRDAVAGVGDGTYEFALVIPQDFSASLVDVAADSDSRIRMVTNDANSYLSTTVANQLVVDVRQAIATEVSQRAASTFLLGLSDVRETILDSAEGLRDLDGDLDEVGALAGEVTEDTSGLAGDADELAELVADTEELIAGATGTTGDGADRVGPIAQAAQQLAGSLTAAANAADEASDRADSASARYASGRGELNSLMDERAISDEDQAAILDVYDRAGSGLPGVRSATRATEARLSGRPADAREIAGAVSRLDLTSESSPVDLDALTEAAAELSGVAEELAESNQEVQSSLEEVTGATGKLSRALSGSAEQIPATDEESRAGIARTLSDPVQVRAASADTDSHSTGLAPFVLALAAWIGALVLFWLVRPLSRRALAGNAPSWRTAFGGWLAPAAVAVVQGALLMAATVVAIELQDSRVPATLGFLLLTCACFVAIIHALVSWLGVSGVFVALVLMFLQLITAGGTFPWETTPAVLHPLHHVLPMGYAVEGLRQLMFGGYSDRLLLHIGVLLAWLAGALLLSTWVARRQRVWTPAKVAPGLVLR